MAGEYSALQVLVTANTRDLARQIAAASTEAGDAASRSLSSKIGSGLASVGKTIGKTLSTGFTVAAGAATAFVGASVAAGKSYKVLYQNANTAFKTVLGTQKASDAMMSSLMEFAKTTPFPRQAYIQAAQQMLSFGINAKNVIPYLDGIQNAVAATGGSADDINQISLILSQISAAGKITGTDLMQLAQRGINAADLIGSQMGKTGAQIKDEITAGSLDAGKALDALTQGMNVKFKGAGASMVQNWSGAVSFLQGRMRDLGSILVEPFISTKGGGYATIWVQKLATLIQAAEPIVKSLVDNLVTKLAPAFQGVGTFLDEVTSAVSGFGAKGGAGISGLVSSLSGLAPVLAPLAGMLLKVGGANIAGAFGPLGPAIEAVTGALGPFGALLASLVATSPAFRQGIASLIPMITGLIQPILGLVKVFSAQLEPVIKALMPVVTEVLGALAAAVKALLPALTPIIKAIGPILGGAIKALAPLIDVVVTAFLQLVGVLSGPLGKILGVVMKAVAGLVPILAKLAGVFANILGRALSVILPILSTLLSVFSDLLSQVLPILMPLIAKLGDVIGTILSKALDAVMPILVLLGQVLSNLMKQLLPVLVPLIAMLADTIGQLLDALMPVVAVLLNLVSQVLAALMPLLPTLANLFLSLVKALLPLIPPLLQIIQALLPPLTQLITVLMVPITKLITLLGQLIAWFVALIAKALVPVITFLANLIAAFAGMIARVIPAVSGFVGSIGRFFSNMWSAAKGAVDSIVSYLVGLPGRAIKAVGNLAATLTQKGKDLIGGFLNGLIDGWNGAVAWFGGLGGKVGGYFHGAVNWLFGAGQQIVNRLVAGIKAAGGAIKGALLSLIPGPLKSLAGKLGLGSPSRLFRDEIGKWIPLGIAQGIEDYSGEITKSLVGAVSPVGATVGALGGPGATTRAGPAVVVENAHFATALDVEGFMRQSAWVVQTQRI